MSNESMAQTWAAESGNGLGICPVCGYRVYLDRRGRIRGHMKRVDGVYVGACEGRGHAPSKEDHG